MRIVKVILSLALVADVTQGSIWGTKAGMYLLSTSSIKQGEEINVLSIQHTISGMRLSSSAGSPTTISPIPLPPIERIWKI
jgi:hypothetical protein